MTPVFGEGVVFDASPERRREMLHNQALRDKFMRGHAATIAGEVEQMVAGWGDEGEIDLLDWFAELTIYTSSACLIGTAVPASSSTGRFAELYHDLERGTDALAYVDPYADIESFRRRDAARVEPGRAGPGDHGRPTGRRAAGRRATADLLDVLMSITDEDGSAALQRRRGDRDVHLDDVRRPPHHLGHRRPGRSSSCCATPRSWPASIAELDELYADGAEVSFQALREMPRLEASIKETLRLHPPLILLLRVAMEDLEFDGLHHPRRRDGGGQPGGLQPDPRGLPRPRRLRAGPVPRARARRTGVNPWTWIPFGAGRHRCVGAGVRHDAAQGDLLGAARGVGVRDWPSPPESYRNDHSKMVVQLEQPCRVRYRRRPARERPA